MSIGRAFVAVVPPAEVLDAIAAAVAPAIADEPDLRWDVRDTWHVTLQFLGRVADADALERAVADAARGCAPFTMQLAGAGAFPKPSRASVVWAGVGEGADALSALTAAVGAATAALGHEPDSDIFRPHLTVARARPARGLAPTVATLAAQSWGPAWTVDAVVLFESETHPDGAIHTERMRFRLG